MRKHRAFKMIGIGILAVALFFVLGYVVMTLWNWLMPSIFGLHTITYWQAYGLLILSKILFGGLRGGGGHPCRRRGDWRERMAERCESMTPEEREKFRRSFRGRWYGEPPAEPQA
jgi:Ca2+/H+ antiporter, TMEM165/GDT1 family